MSTKIICFRINFAILLLWKSNLAFFVFCQSFIHLFKFLISTYHIYISHLFLEKQKEWLLKFILHKRNLASFFCPSFTGMVAWTKLIWSKNVSFPLYALKKKNLSTLHLPLHYLLLEHYFNGAIQSLSTLLLLLLLSSHFDCPMFTSSPPPQPWGESESWSRLWTHKILCVRWLVRWHG